MGAFHLRARLSAPPRSLQHCADSSTHITQLRVTKPGSEGAAVACHSRTVGSVSPLRASKGVFLLGRVLINHAAFLEFVCVKASVARCRNLIHLIWKIVFVCCCYYYLFLGTKAMLMNNLQHIIAIYHCVNELIFIKIFNGKKRWNRT